MVNQNNEFLPLFQPSDSDPVNNARIFTGYYRRNFQILGYKIAADNLVQQVIKNGQDQDILVYPIVYLYRHYLEILFKMIIENGCEYFRIQKNPNTIHGLKSFLNTNFY